MFQYSVLALVEPQTLPSSIAIVIALANYAKLSTCSVPVVVLKILSILACVSSKTYSSLVNIEVQHKVRCNKLHIILQKLVV
jgi:hypothetical protein